MHVDWDEVQKAVFPIKSYEDLCRRWNESFAYPFVCETFNKTILELADYTQLSLGGDARGRYSRYAAMLQRIFMELNQAGIENLLDLMRRVGSHEKLERFTAQSGVEAKDIAEVLKYLVYWFVPMKKPLSGLVRDDPETSEAIRVLRETGVKTNLDILQRGITSTGRMALAQESRLPEATITELVNRADFSRMPWASKATISNIMGAGYGSLAELRRADPEKLYEDFYRYGKSIGKNLKLGNEIENSYRIAKIVPVLVRED